MLDIPENRKVRVILCSDAKNEADDQYAIVHALLTRSFDIKGMVAVHFREEGTNRLSYKEMEKLALLTGTRGQYPILQGADKKLESMETYEYSEGADFIVKEAHKADERPLYVLCMGALTDMAAAILKHPEIQNRLTVVWVGGGRYPQGGNECNLNNDMLAAKVLFSSDAALWQIPSNAYKTTLVSVAELKLRVEPMGELGAYLYRQLLEFASVNMEKKSWINPECWVMGDSGAVGVLLDPQKGYYREEEAPDFDQNSRYVKKTGNRKIRIYDRLNNRMIIEDMFSKIQLYHLSGQEKSSFAGQE